jgi:16S rRNA (uracil1498-N3)-methyltransferase
MPRFFLDATLCDGDVLQLPDDVTRHIQVLRLQPGDPLVLFNGKGGQFSAQLAELDKRTASVRVGEFSAQEAEPPYQLTLAQGIAGGDKMDWLIEKSVELGASGFVPLATQRSVVRLSGERAQRRQAHWQGIVRASCEQCGRNRVPKVEPVQEFGRWLETLPQGPAEGEQRLLLSPRATTNFAALPAESPRGHVIVLIGPEGGLSGDEEEAALDQGFTALGLGPRVLRTETAGMALLAALAARWGAW